MRYVLSQERMDVINRQFTYHAPHGNQTLRYQQIRESAKRTAMLMEENCPNSRELSLALTNLEQAVFWANAAIARNETPEATA